MTDIENTSDFLFYSGSDGNVKIEVILGEETVWVTQKNMAEIFKSSRENVTIHLKNIFLSGELEKNSVCKEYLHTASDNKKYRTKFYNLDVVISVGYRVNSFEATQFRKWATNVLKEFLIKGYVLDSERLKQGKSLLGKDYFDELLERIREIRASERRFYQKITDIYAQCSIDYDKSAPITKKFYAKVQNKLHWAIHQHTAAELIVKRVDASKPHVGLTTWKGAESGGKVHRSDVVIAKNYLSEKELKDLNRVVSMYLDFAENLAERRSTMKMEDWATKLNDFLEFNEYELLKDAGKVSQAVAKSTAESEYEKFRVIQDRNFVSDFDQSVKKYLDDGENLEMN